MLWKQTKRQKKAILERYDQISCFGNTAKNEQQNEQQIVLSAKSLKMSSKLSFRKTCYLISNTCSDFIIETGALLSAKIDSIAKTIEKRVAFAIKTTNATRFITFYIKSQVLNFRKSLPVIPESNAKPPIHPVKAVSKAAQNRQAAILNLQLYIPENHTTAANHALLFYSPIIAAMAAAKSSSFGDNTPSFSSTATSISTPSR